MEPSASFTPEIGKSDPLNRLIEVQEINVQGCDEKIKVFSKYKKDYEQLKKLIDSMKDNVRCPCNIPIAGSQLCLAPGHIIHTNEILVLLGDNYFGLRSSKQAQNIIDRRLKGVGDILRKTEEEKRKVEDWLKTTREHKQAKEEFVEIIEHF